MHARARSSGGEEWINRRHEKRNVKAYKHIMLISFVLNTTTAFCNIHMNKTGSVPPLMAIHFLVFSEKKNFQTMTVYCNTRHLQQCSTYMGQRAVGSRQKCKNLNSTIIFRPIYMQNVFGGTTVHEIYRLVIFFHVFCFDHETLHAKFV